MTLHCCMYSIHVHIRFISMCNLGIVHPCFIINGTLIKPSDYLFKIESFVSYVYQALHTLQFRCEENKADEATIM